MNTAFWEGAMEGMWNKTARFLPPKDETLAVVHLIDDNKEQVFEEAVWHGEDWTRKHTGERVEKAYYYLWRRYEV